MHAQSVCTRCFLHALEGPGDEASMTAAACTQKSCQALLYQFYVQMSNGSHNLFYLFPLDAALNCMWTTILTMQASNSKLNLVCIAMVSSDPHSLSMYRDVEAIIESVDSISRDGLNTCMPL